MLHVVFEDDELLVVNKASGVLSQPGKTRDGSVVTQARANWPDARGPLLVHRLDMDTSGLLVLGKTRRAHRHLQQQFEHRLVKKRYTALLERPPLAAGGVLRLPLIKDWEQRPKQRIDWSVGKPAVTIWTCADRVASDSRCTQASHSLGCRVYLYPHTGRTHQLRVHMAVGLGIPIVGDRLYGQPGTRLGPRLMLHADRLQFEHPVTSESVVVKVDASF